MKFGFILITSVFYLVILSIDIYAAFEDKVLVNDSITNEIKIQNNLAITDNFFNYIPIELLEKITSEYVKKLEADINININIKKLRLISRIFDKIASKLFVEKIDVDHTLFMPWYIQMQLHFCDDRSLKKLFTSLDHESTIFNMLTSKFLFVSQVPKNVLSYESDFKNFSKQFEIQKTSIVEQDKAIFQDAIGKIIHHYYYEAYDNKKHSLITFNFKNYQYVATKLSKVIYLYLVGIINSSVDYSLSFTVDEHEKFKEHQNEKRKVYGELICDIIEKLSFLHDENDKKLKENNEEQGKEVKNKLIEKIKNISIQIPIFHEVFKKIKKNLPETTFIHVHNEPNNYRENRIDAYFGKKPEKLGLKEIYLEYKLASKKLDVIDFIKNNDALNNDVDFCVQFLCEKISYEVWNDSLKQLTENVICFIISKNSDGRYDDYIRNLLEMTKEHVLDHIGTSLINYGALKNNYNKDLILERYNNAFVSYEEKKLTLKRILGVNVSEAIKRKWIKRILLTLDLKDYYDFCEDYDHGHLLYKKLTLKGKLCFFLGKTTSFLGNFLKMFY